MKCPVNQNIKKIRESRGFSQEQLGGKVGLTSASICRIEKGVSSPSISLLWRIAEALDCDPVLFFHSEGERKETPGFWERLIGCKEKKGISRKDLCIGASISEDSFLFWERRGLLPSMDAVLRLAAYMEVDVYWLIYGEEVANADMMRKKMADERTSTLEGALSEIDRLREELAELKGRKGEKDE